MFNKDEWLEIVSALGLAIGAGILIDIGLFCWDIFAESYNCFCGTKGMGKSDLPEAQESTMLYVMIIVLIIGFFIGIFSALSDRNARRKQEIKVNKSNSHNSNLKLANSVWQSAVNVEKSINGQVDEVCYYNENREKDIDNIYKQIENEEKLILENLEKYKVN